MGKVKREREKRIGAGEEIRLSDEIVAAMAEFNGVMLSQE
jgi:hypothetical protein